MAVTRGRAAGTLAAAYTAIVLALLAFGWLLTHPWERAVDPRDYEVVLWLAERRTAELDLLAAGGSHLTDTYVGVALALVLSAVLGRWQRSWLPFLYLTVLMVGHHSMYFITTALISRERPPLPILDPGLVPDHSFPSGHTATAVVLYVGTALLLVRLAPSLRRWVWPLYLVPVVVVCSRLYQGAHHPTDLLASLLYAAAWLVVVTRVLLGAPDRTDRTARPRRGRTPVAATPAATAE